MLINLLFLALCKENIDLNHLTQNYYLQSYNRLTYILQDDVVLVITKSDKLYKLFRVNHPISDTQVLFVRVVNYKLDVQVINHLEEALNYESGKYFYFTSEKCIRIYNGLNLAGRKVIYLESIRVLLRNGLFVNLVNRLLAYFKENELVKFENEDIKFCKGIRTILKINGLQPYIFTEHNKRNQLINDLESITQKNVKRVQSGSSKLIFFEDYIDDMLIYLYSNKLIYTKDVQKYHTLIPSLFCYQMADISTFNFSSNECVTTGITFIKAFNDVNLKEVINYDKFVEIVKDTPEILFTNVIN